ncbi:MAG: DNA polymerase III subunit gamma/tau [Alphaproteobacteria bacterium RIFOXYD12_FULL_60_8]|nr:MAG: DNA polymerase III subunit gamma/tau [Alphaproteobacteria bacterium RIFOXYD12_FULL_60_8]
MLARKYRPTTFEALVGQEALVRTLTNAIALGRIAQAYMLTGVRGVGKTTTARLIARALNCIGPNGDGGPTTQPCGVCPHCTAIAEDRHVDVLEMDAASRTGVGDIRELIEGVRYRPTSARYKVYIIDEVHMLSTQAFNALLKTLEEPPEHVKFIFATTEIRKVPVTVLSRCQRFDLRRVEVSELAAHFGRIAEKEGAVAEPGALALIARAADGSVRDGLSLLDQAIAHADRDGAISTVREAQVRDMLGLADRALIFDLFDSLMKGDVVSALDTLGAQYRSGADPAVVIQDLLEVTHWVTRVKVSPASADDPAVAEAERTRGKAMAEGLSMSVLTRAWQMLLKALGEVRTAPSPLQAAEMALVRLAYAADLPSPADLISQIKAAPPAPRSPTSSPPMGGGGGGSVMAQATLNTSPAPSSAPQAYLDPQTQALPGPRSFEEVVALFREKREAVMVTHLMEHVHLVDFKPGRIEFRPSAKAPPELASRLSRMLTEWTGARWVATISNADGQPTLGERSKADVLSRPLVKAVLMAFPGAVVGPPRPAAEAASTLDDDARPEEEDL